MSTDASGPALIEAVKNNEINKMKELLELGAPLEYHNEVEL